MLNLLIFHIVSSGILNDTVCNELKLITCIIFMLINLHVFPLVESIFVSTLIIIDLYSDINKFKYSIELLWTCMIISFFWLPDPYKLIVLLLVGIMTNGSIRCRLFASAILISNIIDNNILTLIT